jgi:hypothetical protein
VLLLLPGYQCHIDILEPVHLSRYSDNATCLENWKSGFDSLHGQETVSRPARRPTRSSIYERTRTMLAGEEYLNIRGGRDK